MTFATPLHKVDIMVNHEQKPTFIFCQDNPLGHSSDQ